MAASSNTSVRQGEKGGFWRRGKGDKQGVFRDEQGRPGQASSLAQLHMKLLLTVSLSLTYLLEGASPDADLLLLCLVLVHSVLPGDSPVGVWSGAGRGGVCAGE